MTSLTEINDLILQLDQLGRFEHEDLTVATQAAELLQEISNHPHTVAFPGLHNGNRPATAAMQHLVLACLAAYRKHHLGDDGIGWEELSQLLSDALANAIGHDFHQYIDVVKPADSRPPPLPRWEGLAREQLSPPDLLVLRP